MMTEVAPQSLPDVKASSAFRTISEVANFLEVPQHVLRFWESKFQQVRPLKRGGGRRYYRREDVTLLSNIKELLYNQGFTIRGVQKLLKETGRGGIVRPSMMAAGEKEGDKSVDASSIVSPASAVFIKADAAAPLSLTVRREVEALLGELKTMRDMLRQVGV